MPTLLQHPPEARFAAMVRPDGECLVWVGSKDHTGYGRFWPGYALNASRGAPPKSTMAAHRFAYEAAKGPIPAGLVVDHLCRNPSCVNAAHLEAVPQRVNALRGIGPAARNAVKTHCQQGHLLAGDNLSTTRSSKRKRRDCRQCHRERMARHGHYRRPARAD